MDLIAYDRQRQPQKQGLARIATVVEIRLVCVDAVGQPCDRFAHPLLAACEQHIHGLYDGRYAEALGHRRESALSDAACAFHRAEITPPIVRLAHVGEQQIEHLGEPNAAARDAQRRNADAFLEDVARVAGEASGHHTADVLPMRHHADDREAALAAEHRIEHPDVVQMRAAGVRIVVQVKIAGTDVVAVLPDQLARRP